MNLEKIILYLLSNLKFMEMSLIKGSITRVMARKIHEK